MNLYYCERESRKKASRRNHSIVIIGLDKSRQRARFAALLATSPANEALKADN